jgi:hypothetical protein
VWERRGLREEGRGKEDEKRKIGEKKKKKCLGIERKRASERRTSGRAKRKDEWVSDPRAVLGGGRKEERSGDI